LSTFRDRCQQALRELIEAKKIKPAATPSAVMDLMAALKRSLRKSRIACCKAEAKSRRRSAATQSAPAGGGQRREATTGGGAQYQYGLPTKGMTAC
jgi:hypothetical protein